MLLRVQNQVRTAGMAGVVVGLDLGVAMSMAAALGYDTRAVADLLPAAEAGMITGLLQHRKSDADG